MSALGGHPLRHLPPSPPDTDAHDSSLIPPMSLSGHPGADFDLSSVTARYQNAPPERTRLAPRRTSALSYQHSGARDLRDRTGNYSRAPRNLVVVIPPPDFPLNRGHLGNVLSMGPRHRLSQGILMPLFPSMFGQLNAIAREYNFPSTMGLCLYLHINENGITMTPRISDDSWQYLFGHLFENRAPSSTQQLPIGGSIEFDIDLNKARWFDAWVSGSLRDSDPIFPSLGNPQVSWGAHWRGESQPRGMDEQPVEDRWDASTRSHTLLNNSQPATLRHVPRKLSLVDRIDSLGVHAPPKSQDHPDRPESLPTQETPVLSSIPQSAVPQAPESDLELRVNSWRETTELYSVSMTETYQPAPDVGVPAGSTTMDAYAIERNFAHDAYIWSPTSAGPPTPTLEPQFASPRPSSVHLDRHVNGSAPVTPATATTWGPADDEWHSVISTVSRLPSPDTGERVVEDTMAPRRNAVWGNSFGWRSATTWSKTYPYSISQAGSAVRIQLQDGVSEYPNLVIYPTATSTPNTSTHLASPLRSVWGSSFGWQKAVTWQNVYPYSVVTLRSTATIQLCGAGGLVSGYPNLCIYPAVYPHLEIYPAVSDNERIMQPVSVMLRKSNNIATHYPSLVIYPAVYPHFDIYPTVARGTETKASSLPKHPLNDTLTTYPDLVIYPAVYPHFDLYPKVLQVSGIVKQNGIVAKLANAGGLTNEYPIIIIYPSVYPYLDIYPARETRTRALSAVWGVSFGWLSAKTWIQVYPLHAANPLTRKGAVEARSTSRSQPSSRDPASAVDVAKREAVWGSSFGWKDATTWHAVWPTSYYKIHPKVRTRSAQNDTCSNYPYLVIYPAAYPHFAIYPPVAANVMAKESRMKEENDQLSVNLIPHYPNLVIYPAVYPHFDLYPAFATDPVYVGHGKSQSNLRHRRMAMWRAKTAAQIGLDELLANNHCWEVDEPLQLDLAEYAWSQTSAGPPTSPPEPLSTTSIPRSVHIAHRVQGSVLRTPSTATTWGPREDDWYSDAMSIERLPSPDLGQRVLEDAENVHRPWRMAWPFYRATSQVKTPPSDDENTHQRWHMVWPFLRTPDQVKTSDDDENNQDSSHQPWGMVWPLFSTTNQIKAPSSVTVSIHKYPHLVIYPPVYPYFDLYPACGKPPTKVQVTRKTKTSTHNLPGYPHLVIYPPVYPYFDLYPACANSLSNAQVTRTAGTLASTSQAKTFPSDSIHESPHLVIYPAVYPHFDLYPTCVNAPTKPQVTRAVVTLASTSQVKTSASVPASVYKYPLLVIYPPVYPYFNLYPGCAGGLTPKNRVTAKTETFATLNCYPVFDIYPAVYPYFNLYPAIDLQIETRSSKAVSAVRRQSVELRLPPSYPNFDIYPVGYPFNLDSIYPSVDVIKSTQISVVDAHAYPWLVIYQPAYPFVIPYPGFTDKITQRVKPEQLISVSPPVLKSVSVKLPASYPTFDIYPVGYPWSLESIYPAVSIDDHPVVARPLVQLDPVHVTGTVDEVGYGSTKASLAMSEDTAPGSAVSAVSPVFDPSPVHLTETPQREQSKEDVHADNLAIPAPQIHTVAPRKRKTHLELHNAVFRSLGKRPARTPKTHQQLHDEVFQDGVVWTPSGYTQDLSSLTWKQPRVDVPREMSPRRPSQDSTRPRPPRSRPAALPVQSPEKVVFPLVQPPALPPISPLRVRSPGIPSQPSPAVSESPMPRVSSPTKAFTHKRTTSSRLSQAVKSMMPGRRSSSASRPTTPPLPEEHRQPGKDQHQQTPVKFPSLAERRVAIVPPLPHTNVPEILARVPHRKESLVLQRARAYEQSTATNPSSGTIGHKGTHTPFTLPPLPSIPPMTDMVETFEKSKLSFP